MPRSIVSIRTQPRARCVMARSGPFSSRFSRVISRMTDSVKLWALIERRSGTSGVGRRGVLSVPGIGALQVEINVGARIAANGLLQTALPPPAHLARPSRLGKELEDVRAAQQLSLIHISEP